MGFLDKVKGKFQKKEKVEKAVSENGDDDREQWSSSLDFFLSALGYAGMFELFKNTCFDFKI